MNEAATTPDAEHRREPRLRTLLSGSIMFDDHRCTMDCAVRNLSAHGAKVVLPDAYRIPQSFELAIPHHDQVHRAEVAWRKGDAAGLVLADAAQARGRRPRLTPRQSERARLKELARGY